MFPFLTHKPLIHTSQYIPRVRYILLDKVNYDDFEAGDKDTYTVWGQDVGTINAIRLSWENPNSDFEYDDDVLIEYCEVDGLGFNINRWLGSESIWWAEAWPCELKD